MDVHAIYRRLYENIPPAKVELLARGLASVQRYDDGALTLSHLTRDDYEATGAEEGYSEGVVDHLRSLEGTAVAGARARPARPDGRDGMRKVSLRATDDRVDVSRIARAHGGGGHRRAAGFSTEARAARARGVPARASVAAAAVGRAGMPTASCSSTSPPASRRTTSSPRSGGGSAARKVGHAGHAGPVRDRAAARPARARHARAALPHGAAEDLRDRRAAGLDVDTGDPEGEIAPGRMPAEPLALPTGVLASARPPTRR